MVAAQHLLIQAALTVKVVEQTGRWVYMLHETWNELLNTNTVTVFCI